MKFDYRMNELLHKYGIDEPYPWFYETVKAANIIKGFFEEFKGDKLLILCEDKGDFENFRIHIPQHISTEVIYYKNRNLFQLEEAVMKVKASEVENIILITYNNHERVGVEFSRHKIDLIDLYDYFVQHGLNLYHKYYVISNEASWDLFGNVTEDDFYHSMYEMLFYVKKKYYTSQNECLQSYYLQKIIFLYYHIRNFEDGEKYIHEYIRIRPEAESRYMEFLQAVHLLLAEIKEAIAQKKKKDIVIYWLDALTFGEDEKMPYLKSVDEKSMVFKKAFTVMDTTNMAANAMFRQEMPLESRRFWHKEKINESALLTYLNEREYQLYYYGLEGLFTNDKVVNVKKEHIGYVSTSNYWRMLCDMGEAETPGVRIVHIFGCHTPYLSSDLNGERYLPMDSLFCKQSEEMDSLVYQQRKFSMQYEDRQLGFYDKLIKSEATIYFSDHGCQGYAKNNLPDLYHIIFKLKSNLTGRGETERIFSIVHFDRLVKFLLEPETYKFDDIFSETAHIQSFPIYSKSHVKEVYKIIHFNERLILGYRGLIKGNYAYFLYDYGLDVCYELKGSKSFLMGYNRSKELRSELRSEIGENWINLEADEKFKYAKLLMPVYRNAARRMNLEELKEAGVRFCTELIKGIPEDCQIVIRSGGEDTVMFIDCLPQKLRQRIGYIADRDLECAAGNWDIPVIQPEKIKEAGKTYVLIISSNYRREMRKELEVFPDIKIIDVYEHLYQQGFDEKRTLSDILYGKQLVYEEEDFPEIDWNKID